jgi:hypothetical protein
MSSVYPPGWYSVEGNFVELFLFIQVAQKTGRRSLSVSKINQAHVASSANSVFKIILPSKVPIRQPFPSIGSHINSTASSNEAQEPPKANKLSPGYRTKKGRELRMLCIKEKLKKN